jgi:2'-5' RNA ligase
MTSTLPTMMRDRWQHRADPAPGEGVVYWHMPMHGFPQVVSLVREAQQRLAHFGGLHMTPLERLHMTTLVAGPADRFTGDQLGTMARTASSMLADTHPVTVTIGRILYHPEAITLGVSPAEALAPIRNAALAATRMVTGQDDGAADSESWIPHVTVCYSTSHQPAAPLIAELGKSFPPCDVQVSALDLIIQRGPERRWDWSTAATIYLAA